MDLEALKQFVQDNYHVGDIVLIPNQLADTKKESQILHPAKLVRFYNHTIAFTDVCSTTSFAFRYYDLWLVGREYLDSVSETKFTDVPIALVAASNWATRSGVIPSATKKTFSPSTPCSRADVIQFLYNAYGKQQIVFGSIPFVDVPVDASYVDAAKWAVSVGAVTLSSEQAEFKPNESCTHGELVEILWRIAGKPNIEQSSLFAWAELNGLFDGLRKDIFQSDGVCTRGEVAQLLYNSFDDADKLYYVPQNRFCIGDIFEIPMRFVAGANKAALDTSVVGTLIGMYQRYMLFSNNDTGEKMRVSHEHVCDIELVQHTTMAVADRDADLVRAVSATN